MLKFRENEQDRLVDDIRYVIGLDLSTVSSGIALYSVREGKVLKFSSIRDSSDCKIYLQGKKIAEWIKQVQQEFNIKQEELLIAKEQQPLQYGKFTTISTLIAIAKVHGIIENLCYCWHWSVLDVPVATVRKTVLGNAKADKEEVFKSISRRCPEILEWKGEHDIADAIGVCYGAIPALLNFYGDLIKEKKKELKKYKSVKKLQEIQNEINKLKEIRGEG